MIFIYREFGTYNDNGSIKYSEGSITITIIKNNIIEVLICGLHDVGTGIQATMSIKYSENLDLFDTVYTILDKISYDIHYQYMNENIEKYHKDFIINFEKKIKNPELWIFDKDIRTNKGGSVWMNFTRENMKYIKIEKKKSFFSKKNYYVFQGEVNENGVFTYDFPIIESNCPENIYKESRGDIHYAYNAPDPITEYQREKL